MVTEIVYRHEYLTGFAVAPRMTMMSATVMALNHGPFEEHLRVLGITLSGQVHYDSGDCQVSIPPHRQLAINFDIFEVHESLAGSVEHCSRVRILTTSTNLILSVGQPGDPGVKNLSEGKYAWTPFPYYGPNDLVVFTLPGPPEFPPPVGPVENA
jgi:hypothetical protein